MDLVRFYGWHLALATAAGGVFGAALAAFR